MGNKTTKEAPRTDWQPSFNGQTPQVKVVVIGPAVVGKSALAVRFIQNTFTGECESSIEDSYQRTQEIDGTRVSIDILDTTGIEDFRALRDQWIREATVLMICYSRTHENDISDVRNDFEEYKKAKDDDAPLAILVQTKCDLEEKVSEADHDDMLAWFSNVDYAVPHIVTSAKDGINVDEAFHLAARLALFPSSIPIV